jgi:hypothetical protein
MRRSWLDRFLLLASVLVCAWGLLGMLHPSLMPRRVSSLDAEMFGFLLVQFASLEFRHAIAVRAGRSFACAGVGCASLLLSKDAILGWAFAALGLIYAFAAISMFLRRKRRRAESLRWNLVDGKLTRFTTSGKIPTRPLVDYAYQVDGQTHKGSAAGLPIEDGQVNDIGDVMDALPLVRVRYNPAHPNKSRILNEDNPRIPFMIDDLRPKASRRARPAAPATR